MLNKLNACYRIIVAKSYIVQADGYYIGKIKIWSFDNFISQIRSNLYKTVKRRDEFEKEQKNA